MSAATSPGTGLAYGLRRVCAAWGMARSSFYAMTSGQHAEPRRPRSSHTARQAPWRSAAGRRSGRRACRHENVTKWRPKDDTSRVKLTRLAYSPWWVVRRSA